MTNLQKIQSERILKSYGVSPIQKEIDLNLIAERCNDSFNKGIITENEFNSAIDYFEDLMKARNVKYFKREGAAGNYKYYYSEAEYKQKKGLGSKKEEDGGIKMNNLDWGSSSAERNESLDKFNSLKTKEEKESFKKELKDKNESKLSENTKNIGRGGESKKNSVKKEKLEDGTMITYTNKKGEYHSENDMPAIEYPNGDKYWYKNGKLDREGMPAILMNNGDKYFYKNGKLHNESGFAIVDENGMGNSAFYLNGEKLTEKEFNDKKGNIKKSDSTDPYDILKGNY